MRSPLAILTREAFKREALPDALLWWLAADGMSGWYRFLRKGLEEYVGGKEAASALIADICRPMFLAHYERLRHAYPRLPHPGENANALGLVMGGLGFSAFQAKGRFVYGGFLGVPRNALEHLRAERVLEAIPMRARWEELTTHLGEYLIALTQELPKRGLPRANAILGKLCFDAGARYGENARRQFRLPRTPESAVETLRMTEYIFRVNPEHWSGVNQEAGSAYIEGTACPWYTAKGWSMMHCGIFGQFQSGIASVFGLSYMLSQTIPKHGGHTCRVDLKALVQVRKKGEPFAAGQASKHVA